MSETQPVPGLDALARDTDSAHSESRAPAFCILAITAIVLLAFSWPDGPVYATAIKLYLFHLLAWPLVLYTWRSGQLRAGMPEIILGIWMLLNIILALTAHYSGFTGGILINYALYILWFWTITSHCPTQSHRGRLLRGLYAVISLLAAVGLIYHWILPLFTSIRREYRMVVPTGLENSFGAILIPALFLGGVYIFQSLTIRRPGRVVGHGIILLINGAAFMSCRSAGALVGLAAAAGLGVFVLLATRLRGGKRKAVWAAGIGAGLGGAAAGAYAYLHLGGTFLVRRMTWNAGLDMLIAHPFGSGPGSAAPLMPAHLDPVWHAARGFGNNVFHLHNEYLEIGAETGIAGLALFVVFIALILKRYLRDFSTGFGPGMAAGAGLAGLCVGMVAGVSMRLWTLPILFWLLCALAPSAGEEKRSTGVGPRLAGSILTLILLCIAYALVFQSWAAERALSRMLEKDIPSAERQALLSTASRNTLIFRDAIRARMAAVHDLEQQSDFAVNAETRQRTLELLQEINRHHGGYSDALYREGRLLYLQGEYEKALGILRKGLRQNPFSGPVRRRIGWTALQYCGVQDGDLPEEALRKLDGLDERIDDPAERDMIKAMACTVAGMPDRAMEFFRNIQDNRNYLADIAIMAAGGGIVKKRPDLADEALKDLEHYRRLYPRDREGHKAQADILWIAARYLYEQGQYDEARFMFDQYRALKPETPESKAFGALIEQKQGEMKSAPDSEAQNN